MRWAVRGWDWKKEIYKRSAYSPYQRYENAVKLEEATYVTQSAPDPSSLFWCSDPLALKDGSPVS